MAAIAQTVRPSLLEGKFYPAEPAFLRKVVDDYLAQGRQSTLPPKGVIAPHSGYIFSGPVAGSAYASWQNLPQPVRRVVVMGPSHYFDFPGIALPDSTSFHTPLGDVPIDLETIARLRKYRYVRDFDTAHAPEHSIEVQLPFLQQTLDSFAIIPLIVGEASDNEIAHVVEALWGGPETLFVISSDLSHFHDFATTRKLDSATALSISKLHSTHLNSNLACGFRSIRGFLKVAKTHGLRGSTIDLRNSGDIEGPTEQVIGFGAFHFA